MNDQSILACTRKVHDGKIVINLVNCFNDIEHLSLLLNQKASSISNENNLIFYLRSFYNKLTNYDNSINCQKSKDLFNNKFLNFAYVRDLT